MALCTRKIAPKMSNEGRKKLADAFREIRKAGLMKSAMQRHTIQRNLERVSKEIEATATSLGGIGKYIC